MMTASPTWETWFRQHRDRLTNEGLALDGGEPGRQDPAQFETASKRILFCRLSTYADVRPSISHRMLYWAARQIPGVYADTAFFPCAQDAAFLKKNKAPFWLATGCKRPPSEFDILAITISVPQEAFNLPAALRDSGLQLSREAREADPSHPLILLGGPGAGSVPFLHDLVDVICLGDGIIWLQTLLRDPDRTRRNRLPDSLRNLPGTYIPSRYRHSYEKGILKEIRPLDSDAPLPVRSRTDESGAWINGYDGAYLPFCDEDTEETLPLAFGCVYRCRFCQTGWMRKGLDASDREDLVRAAFRLKSAMAASDLNLLASDACSVPSLAGIIRDLLPLFPKISLKSLALASLIRDRSALGLLDKREFAFGVEGISRRLRVYLAKPMDPEALISIMKDRGGAPFRQIKLFFIATGLETGEDLEELKAFLRELRASAPGCRLITSFMPLFHAPFTPLQFDAIRPLTPELCGSLERAVESIGAEFRWSASPDEIGLMNRLCRAGRRAAPLVSELSLDRGIRYDGRLPDAVCREAADLFPPGLICEKAESDVLPWDDLEAGVPRSVLWKSFQAARNSERPATVPAEPVRERGAPVRSLSGPAPAPFRARFWVHLPESASRHPEIALARGQLRDLFASVPDAARVYAGSPRLQHPPGATGLAILEAQFRGRAPLPSSNVPPGSDEPLLFWVTMTTLEIRALQAELKRDRILFQSRRFDGDLGSVIQKGYRAKTGLWALWEGEVSGILCKAQSPASTRIHGRVTAVLEDAGSTLRLLCASDRAPVFGPLGRLFPIEASSVPPSGVSVPTLVSQWKGRFP